ncbi:MAG: cytochrome c-type biogenesis protein CcmH [Alphaproteobacteria bacterium]|nr:cytochrome c-type biogenesis protein CcmH [Alphaproteobacteria bacterium]
MIAALVMAIAVSGDLPLADPEKEARAQSLMREIRCVVCENEPVSQSTADIAVDMRRVIRQQVMEGDTNDEVRKYFSDRYGQFVLFRPPVTGLGLLLWVFPFLLLLGAGGAIAARLSRTRKKHLAPLADDQVDDSAR